MSAEAGAAPPRRGAAKRSFPPVIGTRPRVLVLGTLPGEESLRRQQYYAHPRNLFWPILYALFEASPENDYAARLAFARRHRVALWDVCRSGEREASADATIRREEPNAIGALLDAHPSIAAVAFNGSGARRLHDRHFQRRLPLVYLALPSTSPAYASLDFAAKFMRWRALRAAAAGPPGADRPVDEADRRPPAAL